MERKAPETSGRSLTITIAASAADDRLDRALALALAPALSRSRVKALIESGHVAMNGATIADPSRRVKPGQTFAIILPEASPVALEAEAIPLDVVYEDDELIVVDKPAGMVIHPAPGNPKGTLVNALIAHCGNSLSGIGGVQRPGIVHRLDKDTRGLIVAAKTDVAHRHLAGQFARRTVERVYAALVWGTPAPRVGTISGAIGRSRGDRKKMAVVRSGGKAALTRYRVIKSFAGGAVSLIECRLSTGRTHQIRVHLAALGHPLVGDPVYGRPASRRRTVSTAVNAAVANYKHQALEACVLGFSHPTSGKLFHFEKKYSRNFSDLICTLERI